MICVYVLKVKLPLKENYRFMKFFKPLMFLLLLLTQNVFSQTRTGLVAYYPLDNSLSDATGNTNNGGFPIGDLEYSCGVVGSALFLDGRNDEVIFSDPFRRELNDEDFTISLYFKSRGGNNTQYILSKRWGDCRTDNVFDLRYQPFTNSLNLVFAESTAKQISFIHELNPDQCWYHVVVWRRGPEVRLYVNGVEVNSRKTTSRIDLTNPDSLILGGSNCLGINESRFSGLIDEFRIYNRALNDTEIGELYDAPDQILTSDTLIFEGESVDIQLSSTCAQSFFWNPTTGVFNFFQAEPTITPQSAGVSTFNVSLEDEFDCIARDSIQITVVDPDDLDCDQIFLPNAFTPNGDGLNDAYGISNPFALQQLISFEIYDRWGERVFFTTNPFDKWDGNFKGQEMNSGVLLYKVRYICRGAERVITGGITMMR